MRGKQKKYLRVTSKRKIILIKERKNQKNKDQVEKNNTAYTLIEKLN
jgi:hypothetical protein